jgi:acyl-CoA thioester hydrolase
VRVRLPVLWGDMDALGHVNNLVYLRWFEEARIRYFERAGLVSAEGRIGVILAHQRCDYLAPVTHPDEIEVRCSVTKLGRRSFSLSFVIRSETQGKDAARGEGVLVAFDYASGHSAPISDAVRARIEALEA